MRWLWGAAASLVAHVAVIALLPDEESQKVREEVVPVTVTRSDPEPVPVPAPAPVPVSVTPRATRRAHPAPLPDPPPAARGEGVETRSEPQSDTREPAEPPPPPAQRGEGQGGGTPVAPLPDAPAVRAAVARALVYPRLARRQGISGTVVIRFRIDDAGGARDLQIVQGVAPLLDDAARRAVEAAAPYASPPGWVRVPIVFAP